MKNLGTAITNLQDYERGRESMRQEIVRMVGSKGKNQNKYDVDDISRYLAKGYNNALNDIKEALTNDTK